MAKLRILLADDHAVVRAGLKVLIDGQSDMLVVGEARNGFEAVQYVEALRPDVVVMDLSMPHRSGIEATEHIRSRFQHQPILILSVHEDPSYLRRVLEVGATGYLLKHAATETLITAIRQVALGQVYLDPALSAALVQRMVGEDSPTVGDIAMLSSRELAVLRLIAQGYSNKEIAGQFQLSVKTIETYKSRAMDKLGINSRVEIVRYAATQGWLQYH